MELALFKSFLSLGKPEELQYLDNSSESNWIREHYQTYGSLPLVATFEDHFQVTMPEFTEDWDYYKKNLIDDDYVKQAAPLLEEFNTKAGKMSAKDALLWLRDSLAAVRGKEVMNMGTSILKNAPSRIDFFQKRAGIRCSIGIKPYDDISGGIGEDDILIVAARPGQGKSMLAISIATHMAAQGLRVGFYSSEMAAEAVGARFDSFAGGVSNYAITRGKEVSYWHDYIDSIEDWQGDFIVLTPKDLGGRFATPQDIQAFIVGANLDVVVLDQINGMQLASTRGVSSEDHSKLAELQKQLTAIQKSLKKPFVEVLQLNREATGDNEPQLHMLLGSGRFEQDASAVLGSWRKAKDLMIMKVLKSRDFDGEGQKWEFTVDFDKGKILQRTDAVSSVRNALSINKAKEKDEDDEDLMD